MSVFLLFPFCALHVSGTQMSAKILESNICLPEEIQGQAGRHLFHFPSLFRPEHLRGTAPNHDFSPEPSELTSWGGLKGPLCAGKPQGKQGRCRTIPLKSRHTPGSSRDGASPALKTSSRFCSFSSLSHSSFLLELRSFSQFVPSALVSACPGLMAVM